jgi:aspartate/methionine/tyrosine aminotransferase
MPLNPFKLERYFARYEFNVRYLLCASDCQSWTVGDILALEAGAAERFQAHWLGYTESSGSPALRREICGLYTAIQPQQVLVHSGAEEAIFLFMHAILQPGDHLVVHMPCYQSLFEVARSLGVQVSAWPGRAENGWALDLDDLRASLRPNTRAIVFNTPHNPTGYHMPPGLFQEVLGLARQAGLLVFCDEVYRESEYQDADRLPAACDLYERAVSLGVVSKTYGLPGLRIGWAASREAAVLERMAQLKDYTTICNSAPGEFLAEVALRHRQQLVRRNREIILRNLALLDGFFQRQAGRFSWVRPQAGPIAFPRLYGEPIETFCHRLVSEAGVLLLPGALFEDGGNHFRLGFGRQDMPEALAALEGYLQAQPR